jgi:2-methylisocitrate lyase-like PEP mutase family enzyme
VQVLERAGASGIQLEDRVEASLPHALAQRPVVEVSTMIGKIHAALDARTASTTLISARTDALYSHGLDDAVERAERYIEAGADMVFVEGCISDHDRRRVIDRLSPRAPVLFNAGILPADGLPPYAELAGLGYTVILFPGVAAAAAGAAMQKSLGDLQAWAAGANFVPPAFDTGEIIGASDFMSRFT